VNGPANRNHCLGDETMKTQHTPGPWKVEWASYGDDGYNISGNTNDQPFDCDDRETVAHVAAYYPFAPEAANARLIAAAPDLLENLQYVESVAPVEHQTYCSPSYEDVVTISITWKGLMDIRAAIAKATDAQ